MEALGPTAQLARRPPRQWLGECTEGDGPLHGRIIALMRCRLNPTRTSYDGSALGVGRSCEHSFVTAQGSPLTRYRRAIESRSLLLAELSARVMNHVPLRDALGLLALYAAERDAKYERAAARWLARLALEKPELGIVEIHFAAAALAAMPAWEETAIRVLVDLSSRRDRVTEGWFYLLHGTRGQDPSRS